MLSFFTPYCGIRIRLFPINVAKSQKICWNNLARDNPLQYLFNVHCAKVSFTNTIFRTPRWVRMVKGVWNWSVIKMKQPVVCAQCTANSWLPKNPLGLQFTDCSLCMHSCLFISHYFCLLCEWQWLKWESRTISAMWKPWVIIILKRNNINMLDSTIFSHTE